MSYIVSARKYRPKTFEDVVGQEQITSTLKRSIETDHLAQAFLFCGPRGVGKTTFVESCINEYQEATFRRFLRSNYGRSPFDLIMMALLAISVIFIFMAASNFAGILAVDSHDNKSLLLPLIAVLIFILIPFFYGWLIVTKIVKSYGAAYSSLIGAAITVLTTLTLWKSESLQGSNPPLSMSILLFSLRYKRSPR